MLNDIRSFKRYRLLTILTVVLIASSSLMGQTFTANDIPMTGGFHSSFDALDTDIRDYMVANNVTAVNVALMKDGYVYYERGFGWRDYYGGDVTPIKSNNVMRIASVNKPITAAAIQKLISDGVISATDKVFAYDQAPGVGILPAGTYAPYTGTLGDPRLKDITVRDLLLHRGGFDSNNFEPQFSAVFIADQMGVGDPPGRVNTVNYMLSQPLRFTPGASSGLCSTYAWTSAVNYTTGTNPRSVAVSDLDDDGNLDLATANNGSNNVSVLLGNGDGSFAAPVNYAAGNKPYAIAIGDMDNDTVPDIVVTNETSDDVSVFLNNGNGTFAAAITTSTGDAPLAVAIGDLNGDGTNDVVTANSGSNDVNVLRGNGDGTLTLGWTAAVGTNPQAVAVLGIDGVNNADVITANFGSNDVSVLLNNGNGTLAAAVNYPVGTEPSSIALSNVDGTNRSDIIVGNEASDNISVLLNDNTGNFLPAVNYAAGNRPRGVLISDLDGDGNSDIAACNASGATVSILPGNGDGTFGSAASYSTGSFPRGIAMGDFDNNSTTDLVTSHSSSTDVWVLLREGSGDNCYSNFGFLLLGLIIEEVTQPNYDDYMDYIYQNFLATWGAAPKEMLHGRSLKEDQDPREPIYEYSVASDGTPPTPLAINVFDPTGSKVFWPYGGWEHEVFLGHGDLVTNTMQMLEFTNRYLQYTDYNNISSEIGKPLSQVTIPRDRWGHAGSLTGTNSVTSQDASSNLRIAVIVNQRIEGSVSNFATDILNLVHDHATDAGFTYPSVATNLWLEPSPMVGGMGTFVSPFHNLATTLSATQSRGRIKIKPGSYPNGSPVTISQAVRLEAPAGQAVLGQ